MLNVKTCEIFQAYKPTESQYFTKDHHAQFAQNQKYNNFPSAQSRKYASNGESDFLSRLSRIDPNMARSIMGDYHLRETQTSYSALNQNRMYTQNQHLYAPPSVPSNTYPPNYGMAQHYNYNSCSYKGADFTRNHQMNVTSRYPTITPHIDRNQYTENLSMPMNYAPIPQKISPNYAQYNSPEYAQHYQHRRFTQEYYTPQHYRPTQYIPNSQIHSEVTENRVPISDNLKQYIENWADEETVSEMNQMENRNGRNREDTSNETIVMINPSELQYIENGSIPLVTCEIPENGQYVIKNVVENSGVVRIIESKDGTANNNVSSTDRIVNLHIMETPKTDCMLADKKSPKDEKIEPSRVVIHSNTLLTENKRNIEGENEQPENLSLSGDHNKNHTVESMVIKNTSTYNVDDVKDNIFPLTSKETVDKNCSPINVEQLSNVDHNNEAFNLVTNSNDKTESNSADSFNGISNFKEDELVHEPLTKNDSPKECTKSMPLIFDGNNNDSEKYEKNVSMPLEKNDESNLDNEKADVDELASNLSNQDENNKDVGPHPVSLTNNESQNEKNVETEVNCKSEIESTTSNPDILDNVVTSVESQNKNEINLNNNKRSRRIFSVDDIIGNKTSTSEQSKKERRRSLQITQNFIDTERNYYNEDINDYGNIQIDSVEDFSCSDQSIELKTNLEESEKNIEESKLNVEAKETPNVEEVENKPEIKENTETPQENNIANKEINDLESKNSNSNNNVTENLDLSPKSSNSVVETALVSENEESSLQSSVVGNDEQSIDNNTEVQYRSAIRIEENSVLLEIGGELVEINVNVVNGKKVITVVPISETTMVDVNDNYESDMENDENKKEEVLDNEVEELSNTSEEVLTDTIESTIELNTVDIIDKETERIDDDIVGETVIMDTGNEIILESDVIDNELTGKEESIESENHLVEKLQICTKAAKKAYSDEIITDALPPVNDLDSSINKEVSNGQNDEEVKELIDNCTKINDLLETNSEEKTDNSADETDINEHQVIDNNKNEKITRSKSKSRSSENELNEEYIKDKMVINHKIDNNIIELKENNKCSKNTVYNKRNTRRNSTIADQPVEVKEKIANVVSKKNKKIERKVCEIKKKNTLKNEQNEKKLSEECDDSEEYVDFKELVKARKLKKMKNKINQSELKEKVPKTNNSNNRIVKPKPKLEKSNKMFIKERIPLKNKKTLIKEGVKIKNGSIQLNSVKTPSKQILTVNVVQDSKNVRTKRKAANFPGKPRKHVMDNKKFPKVSSTKICSSLKKTKPEKISKNDIKDENDSSTEKVKEKYVKKVSFAETIVEKIDESYKVEKAPNHLIIKAACDSSSEVNTMQQKPEDSFSDNNSNLSDSIDNHKKKLSLQEYNFRKRKYSSDMDKEIISTIKDTNVKMSKYKEKESSRNFKEGSKSPVYDLDTLIISCKDCKDANCVGSKTSINCLKSLKSPNDPVQLIENKEPLIDLIKEKQLLEKKRLYDWEENQSPVHNPISNKCDSDDDKLSEISSLIKNKPNKCVINVNDLKPLPSETSKDEMLQIYKEQVHSKLSSLNIQIPKMKNTAFQNKPLGNNFSFISSEYQKLMKRFLNNEKISHDEMEKIKQIISYKRIIEQMKHSKDSSDIEVNQSPLNPTYEVHQYGETDRNDIKLHLKKVSGSNRRKRTGFRDLYDVESDDSESSNSDICDLNKNNDGDYSVIRSDSFDVGVPKLIIKRKPDLTQPVVRLERLNMDLVVKKRKFM